MKPQKNEIIPGDPSLRYPWIMGIAIYLLLFIWFEPLLDQTLKMVVFEPTPQGLTNLNQQKVLLAGWGYTLLRSLPLLLFLWLGWQIAMAKRIPPPGVKLPFAVPLIKGQKAQMIGMGMIALSLLSLLREVGMLALILLA